MKRSLTLAAFAFLAAGAFAQNYITSGELTTSDPSFNRPVSLTGLSGVGTNVHYDVFGFTTDVSGAYTGELHATGTAPFDTYLFVYANSFDPSTPLTNLINGDDDYVGAFTVLSGSSAGSLTASRITPGDSSNYAAGGLNLTAGVNYYAVVTSFGNGAVGTYDLGIGGGPGNVTALGSVPEPASLAVLGMGALALLRRRRQA